MHGDTQNNAEEALRRYQYRISNNYVSILLKMRHCCLENDGMNIPHEYHSTE